MNIRAALRLMVEKDASDLHLTAGNPPAFRVHGQLLIDEEISPVRIEDLGQDLDTMLDEEEKETFLRDREVDFAFEIPGLGRFRGNLAMERGRASLVFRHVTELKLDFEALGLPPVCKELVLKPRGLVIVAGPAGSGKSTTLAAMIDYINSCAHRRVVTLEDPIEYIFTNKLSVITQRQVGKDTRSFTHALNHVLRQNPDIIVVGEMRDLATVSAVLTATETGHLILTTSHAPSAPQVVERILDMFPSSDLAQVRSQLAANLLAVLYQQLIPRANGNGASTGRVLAVEVLLANAAVRNLIRGGQTHQLYSAMQLGVSQGMQLLDQALLDLCLNGKITEENALALCHNSEQLQKEFENLRTGPTWVGSILPKRG